MKLYDYQRKIVDTLKPFSSWAMFMNVGSGKSLTSLTLIKEKEYENVLVVCRKNKIKEWQEELDYHCINAKVVTYNKMIDETYSDYDFILLDESQNIKTFSKSVRWKWLRNAKDKGMCFGLLSGTPQHHMYIDYYTTFYLLDIFKNNVTNFKSKFCNYENARNGNYQVLKSYSNEHILLEFLRSDNIQWFFNQEQEPIHKYISYSTHTFDKVLRNDRVYKSIETGEDMLITTPAVLHLKRLQLASGYLDGIVDLRKQKKIIELIKKHKSVIIFTNYTNEIKLISMMLKQSDIKHKIYCGWRKDDINENDDVLIVNTNSGGSGVNNFKHINVAIYNSVPIKYIDLEQSKGRINRIGSTQQPIYYYLQTPLEQAVYQQHKDRKHFDDKMFNEIV